MKTKVSQIEVKPWDPDSKVHRDAFTLICLRAAQALTSWSTETQGEKAFREKWQSYPVEERETALEATLNHFVGGTFSGLKENLVRERKERGRIAVKEAFGV